MTQETLNTLMQKAIKKGTGLGKWGVHFYFAINGRLVFFFDNGRVYQLLHGFIVGLGDCERHHAERRLKELGRKEKGE